MASTALTENILLHVPRIVTIYGVLRLRFEGGWLMTCFR